MQFSRVYAEADNGAADTLSWINALPFKKPIKYPVKLKVQQDEVVQNAPEKTILPFVWFFYFLASAGVLQTMVVFILLKKITIFSALKIQ